MIKSRLWFSVSFLAAFACQEKPEQEANVSPAVPERPVAAAPATTDTAPTSGVAIPGIGACQPSQGMETAFRRAMELFDSNEDGKLSRVEATSGVNFLLGGFFFRADQNGDGTITPEEGKQERADLAQRYPAAAELLAQVKRAASATTAFDSLARILDTAAESSLSLADAKKAASGAVDDSFRLADTNQDKEIDGAELAAVSLKVAKDFSHRTFAAADTDGDKSLTVEEFQNALAASTRPVFQMADLDRNGRLSETEAAAAISAVAQQLGIPRSY